MNLICPECQSTHVKCVKCGKYYPNGKHSHCPRPVCRDMNFPLECLCGFITTEDLRGMRSFNSKIINFIHKKS